jgi:alpha-glucosidase (family GH31 glycosyl hydrolase)
VTPPIQVQERDTTLLLYTSHSQLELSIWRASFRLMRGERLILQSGAGWGEPVNTLNQWQVEDNSVVLIYNRGTHGLGRLVLTVLDDGWHFAWDQPTRDTFDLASAGHWYGQGELIHQGWPLEQMSLWEAPFLTWDNGPTGLGNIQTPAWITSTGLALLVEPPVGTLHMGFNAPPVDVPIPDAALAPAFMRPNLATRAASGLLTVSDPAAPLRYRLILGPDAPSAFRSSLAYLGKPPHIPPEALLRDPIWTTWARYKATISQATVLAFAQEIRDHDFPGGTLEIDDKWQQEYGDTAFDPARFPDPGAMIERLNEMGFAATLWVTPFIHPYAANAPEAVQNGYVVRTPEGEPYLVTWWQGKGYLLDASNPHALKWWAERLKTLQDSIGLAGFKFDAGEANFLPADATMHSPFQRNEYSARWAEFGATHFPYCEARCGWYSQRQPILFRQWDKFSTWGLDNGLASVITSGLALSLSGYPFTLPDMVGGNAYNGVNADKELLIRWTQASAPMLAIQFSLAPWDYDEETVTICRKYAQLFAALADDRIAAARQAVATGDPVIRPIFWGAPRDAVAQTVRDEYLLGDNYLVAPVVTPQTRQRDVYLPAGRWRDYWSEAVFEGGLWLRDYPAPLDVLPLFVRL